MIGLSLSKCVYLLFCFRYTLKAQGQGAGAFNIGPSSGVVKLAKELDFEDLRQPHIYQLLVTATEDSGGFSTSVEVSFMEEIQCDQIGRFIGLWATFQSPWQQLFCPNLPRS